MGVSSSIFHLAPVVILTKPNDAHCGIRSSDRQTVLFRLKILSVNLLPYLNQLTSKKEKSRQSNQK